MKSYQTQINGSPVTFTHNQQGYLIMHTHSDSRDYKVTELFMMKDLPKETYEALMKAEAELSPLPF